jgi:hypothetical protein
MSWLARPIFGTIPCLLSIAIVCAGIPIIRKAHSDEQRRPFIEVPPARIIEPERFFVSTWGWVTCNDTGEFELRKNPIWKRHCEPVDRKIK